MMSLEEERKENRHYFWESVAANTMGGVVGSFAFYLLLKYGFKLEELRDYKITDYIDNMFRANRRDGYKPNRKDI